MAYLINQERWKRKPPQFGRVDLSHPLARGLRMFADCRGSFAVDLVRRIRFDRTGVIPGAWDVKAGNIVSKLDTTDTYTAPLVPVNITGNVAIVWRGSVADNQVNADQAANVDGTAWGWGVRYNSLFPGLMLSRYNAAATDFRDWNAATQPSSNVDFTWGAWQSGGIQQTPVGYFNRAVETFVDAGGTGTGTAYSSTAGPTIGVWTSPSSAGRTSHVLVFARTIDPGWYFALEENPWQILEPAPRLWFVPPPAALGGPSFRHRSYRPAPFAPGIAR